MNSKLKITLSLAAILAVTASIGGRHRRHPAENPDSVSHEVLGEVVCAK